MREREKQLSVSIPGIIFTLRLVSRLVSNPHRSPSNTATGVEAASASALELCASHFVQRHERYCRDTANDGREPGRKNHGGRGGKSQPAVWRSLALTLTSHMPVFCLAPVKSSSPFSPMATLVASTIVGEWQPPEQESVLHSALRKPLAAKSAQRRKRLPDCERQRWQSGEGKYCTVFPLLELPLARQQLPPD